MTDSDIPRGRPPTLQDMLQGAAAEYWRRLYGFADSLIGALECSEDLVEIAFLELLRTLGKGGVLHQLGSQQGQRTYVLELPWRVESGQKASGEAQVRAVPVDLENWLRGVIRRRSYSIWRKEYRFRIYAATVTPVATPSESERIDYADDLRLVLQLMEQVLSERDRRLIMMSASGEYDYKEIAYALDCGTAGAARVAVHRARARLAESIERSHPDLVHRLGLA